MNETLPLNDLAAALVTATRGIGHNSQRVGRLFSNFGMPSEYRSGLFAALDEAQRFLRRRRNSAARIADRELIGLAENVVELVHAIIFAMKHDLPYDRIMHAGLASLDADLCSLGIRETPQRADTP
jgi:hypothetical protein